MKDVITETSPAAGEKSLPRAVIDAQAAGKKVLELAADDGKQYFFLKPTTVDMKRFIATVSKQKIFQAVNDLIFEKALAPTKDELAAEFEEMPGRMVALNNELQAAIGMNESYTVKKL